MNQIQKESQSRLSLNFAEKEGMYENGAMVADIAAYIGALESAARQP
jgi:hypothetical protein